MGYVRMHQIKMESSFASKQTSCSSQQLNLKSQHSNFLQLDLYKYTINSFSFGEANSSALKKSEFCNCPIQNHFAIHQTMAAATRHAVVTGANKGIGFETCKQLASNGITVVLTARNEKRGLEAADKLKQLGLSGHVIFHQLDITDPASVATFADFIKTSFGKLDILINNAAAQGSIVDAEAFAAAALSFNSTVSAEGFRNMMDSIFGRGEDLQIEWNKIMKETNETVEEALNTNYFGTKRITEATIQLLQLSESPKIVNVSSPAGKLENISNEWAKHALSDVGNLSEEKVEEVLKEFLKDFKEGASKSKGWPRALSSYIVSKAAVNAYTSIVAKRYPSVCVNAISPGFVTTDMSCDTGLLSTADGAHSIVRLALLPEADISGRFLSHTDVAAL